MYNVQFVLLVKFGYFQSLGWPCWKLLYFDLLAANRMFVN